MRNGFLRFIAVIAAALLLCSCSKSNVTVYEINDGNAWLSYPAEDAPLKVIRAGERWYSLVGSYGHGGYSLSVSSSYVGFNKVYSAPDALIWFFEAEEENAVFSEMYGAYNRIMLCCGKSGEVSEIFRADCGSGYQNSCIGIYDGYVYFTFTDYAGESAQIKRYCIETAQTESFYVLPYLGEHSCHAMSVDSDTLVLASGSGKDARIMKFDLDNGGEPEIYELENDVGVIFSCAFDTATEDIAVYYSDSKGMEHKATLNKDNGRLRDIYTFAENVYAYQDSIEMHGGHVYWIRQTNASGMVADHYQFVDYDTASDTVKEYIRTFSFTMLSDGIQLLSFNKADYDAIYLTEIYLGGNEE